MNQFSKFNNLENYKKKFTISKIKKNQLYHLKSQYFTIKKIIKYSGCSNNL